MAWQWVEFLYATVDSSYVPAVYRKGVPKGATAEDLKKLSKEASKYNDDMQVIAAGYIAGKDYLDREGEYMYAFANQALGDKSYVTPINRTPVPAGATASELRALSKESNRQNSIIQEIAPNIESMVVNDIPFIITAPFDGGASALAAGAIVDARLAAMGEAPASHLGKLAVVAKNMASSTNAPITSTSEVTSPAESLISQNVELLSANTSGEVVSKVTSPAENANFLSQATGNQTKPKPSLLESIGSNFVGLGTLVLELVTHAFNSLSSLFKSPEPDVSTESLVTSAKHTLENVMSQNASGLPNHIAGAKPIKNVRGKE